MASRSGVRIFEVGVRDGLQNEPQLVPTASKVRFINDLVRAGVRELELGAFVRPDRVPQMADTAKLHRAVLKGQISLGRAKAWSLVPNVRGLHRAIEAGATHICLFTAATDGFAKANIGMSVRQSLQVQGEVLEEAKRQKIQTRGYVSTAFGCPFDGKVNAKKPLKVIEALVRQGVREVSIGDTIGVATPKEVDAVVKPAIENFGADRIAVHFHDTRGGALANVLRSLEHGVKMIDASAGGLGGCPFAPGASGNVATEDVVYMLHGMGIKTGIDLDALCEASLAMAKRMKRPLSSRYLMAHLSAKKKQSKR